MRFKEWLKFFGLSFFSDKQASSATNFGFIAIVLNIVLAFVFFWGGYYATDVVPFSAHYDAASTYREFIDNAFQTNSIELRIENSTAVCNKKINSYNSDEAYKKNGYNLIVDTRPSDMLIEFTQVGVKGETEISYEEYRLLDDTQKKEYKVETRYTDVSFEFTDEAVETYENFLSTDDKSKTQYEELDKSADDYNEQLYYLYVKHYYVSVTSMLRGAKAPVLRDYYYKNYISDGNAYYLYVFDDMIAGSFKTDGNIPIVFGGYFKNCKDGQITDIHGLIKDVYYDTVAYTSSSYFLSSMSLLPMIILIPLIFAFIMWGIGKAVKNGWVKAYGGCLKIIYSFVWVSALITAIVIFALGWAVSARLLYSLIPVIFGGVLLVRIIVYCVVTVVKNSKRITSAEQNNKDIFGDNL